MPGGITLPSPLQRDIEIIRIIGNLSNEVPQVITNVTEIKENETSLDAQIDNPIIDSDEPWVGASQDVLYYIFPVLFIWGVATGIVAIVVLSRQLQFSNDTYLIGFVLCGVLLLSSGGAIKLQDYIAHSNAYQYAYGYVKCLHDWLWYTSLWVLIVMTLERALNLSQGRSKSMCSPLQASVVSTLVYLVCLISAIPQFWEYEVTETWDYGTNTSLVMAQLSSAATSPEYSIMYFWYTIVLTVLLPYPILVGVLTVLVRGMRRSLLLSRPLSAKHTPTGEILNRKVTEEVHITRLYIVLILAYLVFTGPLTFIILINGINPYWAWPQDHLYTGLYPIFELIFYFYYATLFCLLCSYSDRFRRVLLRTFCCHGKGCQSDIASPEHEPLKQRKAR